MNASPASVSAPPEKARIVGAGRAGGSMAAAMAAAGFDVEPLIRRGDPLADAARGVDLLILATPDAAIAEVASLVEPGEAVVAHLAGSLGLGVLAPHRRRAAIHPLVSLPSAEVGAQRLREGAWFAVAGDPLARRVAEALGGRVVEVADGERAAYHAAACIASNHLVALMGQVERVAASVGVPLEAYLDLARATLENITAMGPAAALTGPAARGDIATLERHRSALDPDEVPAYDTMVGLARRLVSPED